MWAIKCRQMFAMQLAHKSHFWKPKFCQAIPNYMQPQLRDPFEYPLRTRAEIDAQLKEQPLNYKVWAQLEYYPDLYGQKEELNRRVTLYVDMKELNLKPKQKDRLIFLLGPRYKNDDILKIRVHMYADYEQNIAKGKEMIYELYLEAIRAPLE